MLRVSQSRVVFVIASFALAACHHPQASSDADADDADGRDAGDGGSGDATPDSGGDAGRDGDHAADGDADADADFDGDGDILSIPCDRPTDFPPFRPAKVPLDGQMLFPVGFGGEPGPYVLGVDTGAVKTTLEERFVTESDGMIGRATIDFGYGLKLTDYEVLVGDLSDASDHIGVEIHGLIGQDLFKRFYFGLDYVTPAVAMGAGTPDDPPPGYDADDGVDVPYVLEQEFPIVEVDVGGVPLRLIADTGSGVTIVVESSVPSELLDDGLEGYVWHTSYGSDPGVIVRLPSLTIGGATVEDTWAVVIPDEHHLAQIFRLLGVDMQGFLGFPVYRRFFVSVIGCEDEFVFYPTANLDHIDGYEWDRVGVELVRTATETSIDMVYSPSDAADQGVTPGDVLVAVDSAPTDGAALDDIRLLLRGTPGETRELSLTREGVPVELTVAVDRLLPPLE